MSQMGDIMTARRGHGCPAPSSDLSGLLGHADSGVQSALESSRLEFKSQYPSYSVTGTKHLTPLDFCIFVGIARMETEV